MKKTQRRTRRKEKEEKNVSAEISQETSKEETISFWYKIIPPSLLSLITFVLYLPSLNYPFQFDDIANISKNYAIRFDNPLARWWWHSRWFGDWLNRVNFQLGRFEPFYYRLFNVMIHIFSGVALFYLVYNLCRCLKKRAFFYNNAILIATTTTALFLLHPVQSQTVSYVIQARLEGLATLFVLTALTFFVAIFRSRSIYTKVLFSFLFFLAWMFSWGTKEIVVVLPFLIFLIGFFFIAQQNFQQFKKWLWVYLILGVCFFAFLLHYFGLNYLTRVLTFKTAIGNNRGNILTEHAFAPITPLRYMITEFRVIVHYIWMFIWPFGISVEYDWKLSPGFFSPTTFLSFLTLISLLTFSFYGAIKKRFITLSFGLLWFFLCVSPRSIFIPSPELVCDYKTYLASVGILFILGTGLTYLLLRLYQVGQEWSLIAHSRRFLSEQSVIVAILLVMMMPVCLTTFLRNQIWRSGVEFWADNVKKSPNKARCHNNYGVALSEAAKKGESKEEFVQRVDKSIEAYKKAIALDRHYQDPLSNLSVAYSMKGDLDSAILWLKKAIFLAPNYAEAHNNLGSLYIQKGMYEEGEKMLRKALKIRPYYGKAFYNLARMYEKQKNNEKVYEYLKKASKGDLDVPQVFYQLGLISLRLKKHEDAVIALKTALQRGFNNSSTWFNLANAYFMLKKYDEALSIYQRLAQQNPTDGRYVFNLGETYFGKKDYKTALAFFRKASLTPRPLAQSFVRIANCLENLKKTDEAKHYLNSLLATNSPERFKKMIRTEVARLTLQEKYVAGNGTIKLSDLREAMAIKNTTTAA